ncbi:hypothetical protein QFC19_006370 [Naganishia cerealis]|uniref:Uncharacterized protein n=1 Tax=Naganishia cerealis TaxID=610337 RepID=A0ACC2VHT4_9TREE|nr:hypothetical protein QFC19_006370 [Naganishia cerealis]
MYDEESVNDSIRLATLYFKNEEYSKSIKLYNKVIHEIKNLTKNDVRSIRKNIYKLSEVPPVGPLVHPKLGAVLDQCAAAYEKMNNLQRALHQGEQLMEYEPLSCKGYLRVSKILIMMNKDLDAYKVTQRGLYYLDRAQKLYRVDIPEKHYSSLQARCKHLKQQLKTKQQNTVMTLRSNSPESESSNSSRSILPAKRSSSDIIIRQIRPTKSTKKTLDPLDLLTDDILELVFLQLPLKSIFACHQVSKKWYEFLTKIPRLYNKRVCMREKITSQEFSSGIKFLSRVMNRSSTRQIELFRLRSVLNLVNFSKIMDQLFISMARTSIAITIRELDIMNQNLSFHMLMNQVCKFASSDTSLLAVKALRIGFNSYVPDANLLLSAFPGLESLEMVILENTLGKDCSEIFADHFSLREMSARNGLHHLSLINHPKLRLQVTNLPIHINDLPSLESLKVASFNFTNDIELRQFLQNSENLRVLYLENNTALSITSLLRYIQFDGAQFKLRSLAVREATAQIRSWDVNPADLPQLHDLVNLDLYSTSLSTRSFIRLLQVANHNGNLQSLAIRNSTNIQFMNDTLVRNNSPRLTLGNIMEMCPDIEHLYLNEVGVDNTTLRNFARELATKRSKFHLKSIDLSFCERLDGTGILSLLESVRSSNNSGTELGCKLQAMTLHGLPIYTETLQLLRNHPAVDLITHDPTRLKWREYGRNTLVFE